MSVHEPLPLPLPLDGGAHAATPTLSAPTHNEP
jgi:hypothetical protein